MNEEGINKLNRKDMCVEGFPKERQRTRAPLTPLRACSIPHTRPQELQSHIISQVFDVFKSFALAFTFVRKWIKLVWINVYRHPDCTSQKDIFFKVKSSYELSLASMFYNVMPARPISPMAKKSSENFHGR